MSDIREQFEDWHSKNIGLHSKVEYARLAWEHQQAEITRLNAMVESQNETIKIMEDLINSEPRTFDEDIWESLAKKSIDKAMKERGE